MKHNFVLDENVLYFAVKGVDRQERPDLSGAQLVLLIASNCHTITITPELRRRYSRHLRKLAGERSRVIAPSFFEELFVNSTKARQQDTDGPSVPEKANIPRKDVHVVRAALLYRSVIVTGDEKLANAVNTYPGLGLRALSTVEALAFARET